jgi:molybdopterin-guanine dinucleotide biosynthesis protein A
LDHSPALAGLVLAGGRSRRFGRDKALVEFGGRTLLEVAVERFSRCGARAVAVRDNRAIADQAHKLGAVVLSDVSDAGEGPLAGIAAGLAWANATGFAALAVAPCDAPLLTWRHYTQLLTAIADAPAAFAASGDDDHPLCAIWRSDQHFVLHSALEGGHHPSVRGFMNAHGARRVTFSDARAFANANTARDLADLEAVL